MNFDEVRVKAIETASNRSIEMDMTKKEFFGFAREVELFLLGNHESQLNEKLPEEVK